MPLVPLSPVDTRALFRPVSADLVALLRRLNDDDWQRPTVAGRWVVRDVLAHLVDLTCRRLSFHRDRMPPPPPSRPIRSGEDFVAFINDINAEWVDATKRCSPRVLTDMFELASTGLADWFEALPLEAPALFGVSWAGEQTSEGWFDVGREFVELWHHQQQIRLAVGAASPVNAAHLGAVIAIAMRGLPHAFRDTAAETGAAVVVAVTGPAGGTWTVMREPTGWMLACGEPATAAARVRLSDDAMWRLVCNALDAAAAARAIEIDGDRRLAAPISGARAMIV